MPYYKTLYHNTVVYNTRYDTTFEYNARWYDDTVIHGTRIK